MHERHLWYRWNEHCLIEECKQEDNAEECCANKAQFDWCSVRPPGGSVIVSLWLVGCLGAPQHHLQLHGNSPLLLFLFACRERERLHDWWLNKSSTKEVKWVFDKLSKRTWECFNDINMEVCKLWSYPKEMLLLLSTTVYVRYIPACFKLYV